MAKLKTLILMFVLLSTTTFCYSNWTNPQDNGDGTPIDIKQSVGNNSNDRSSSINAFIDGNSLTVSFLSDIGQVTVKVLDENNHTLDLLTTPTPTGYLYYIPNAGRYTVVFTFADGDEYYGEFEVTE